MVCRGAAQTGWLKCRAAFGGGVGFGGRLVGVIAGFPVTLREVAGSSICALHRIAIKHGFCDYAQNDEVGDASKRRHCGLDPQSAVHAFISGFCM
jgi:hypothetical protein